ncbi:hypothetical protein LXL04_024960 [Taraxacum kok-saghyz]
MIMNVLEGPEVGSGSGEKEFFGEKGNLNQNSAKSRVVAQIDWKKRAGGHRQEQMEPLGHEKKQNGADGGGPKNQTWSGWRGTGEIKAGADGGGPKNRRNVRRSLRCCREIAEMVAGGAMEGVRLQQKDEMFFSDEDSDFTRCRAISPDVERFQAGATMKNRR